MNNRDSSDTANRNQLIQLMTFCKKIGGLLYGFDVVKQALFRHETDIVILASDLSIKTKKEMVYLCNQFDTPIYHSVLTLDEYWYLIGKRTGIFSVTHQIFAAKLQKLLIQMADSAQNSTPYIQSEPLGESLL